MGLLLLLDEDPTLAATATLSDSVAVSDSLATGAVGRPRTLADTTTVSDSLARTVAPARAPADTVTVSDSLAFAVGRAAAAADSVTVTDSLARAAVAPARTQADTVTVSDSPARTVSAARTLTDFLNPAVPTAIPVVDTFPSAANVTLSNHAAHQADTGQTWTSHPSGTQLHTHTDQQRVRCAAAGAFTVVDYAAPAEYDLSVDLNVKTVAGTSVSLAARVHPTIATYYRAEYRINTTPTLNVWRINKITNASSTILATFDIGDLNVGQTYNLKFVIRDAYKALVVDGTEIVRTTDNAHTYSRVGIQSGGGVQNGTGIHYDNFQVAVQADIWDTLVPTVGLHPTAADTVVVSDTLTGASAGGGTRTASDTVVVSDTAARAAAFARTAADTVLVSDALASAVGRPRAAADTVAVADTLASLLGRTRTLTDSAAVTDALSRTISAARTLTDSALMVAAILAADAFTDTTGVALEAHTGDTGQTWSKHPTLPAGSLLITNNRLRTSSANALYTSSFAPTSAEYDVVVDHVAVSVPAGVGVGIGQTARMDATAATFYHVRWTQDTQTWQLFKFVNGVISVLGSYAMTLTTGQSVNVRLVIRDAYKAVEIDGVEQIRSTDNAITGAGLVGVRSSAPGSTTGIHLDNLQVQQRAAVPGMADSVTSVAAHPRTASDSVIVADTVAALLGKTRTAADSVTVADALARTAAFARAAADSVTVTQTTVSAAAHPRAVADTVTVADAVSALLGKSRAASDAVTVTDAVARLVAEARALADTVTVTQTVAGVGAHPRAAADSVTVGDTFALTSVAHTLTRTAADTVVVSDAWARGAVGRPRAASDTVTVSDSWARATFTVARTAADTLVVTQTVARVGARARALADTLTVGDTVTRIRGFARTAADTVIVGDQWRAGAVGMVRTLTDSFTTGDSITFELIPFATPDEERPGFHTRPTPGVWTGGYAGAMASTGAGARAATSPGHHDRVTPGGR